MPTNSSLLEAKDLHEFLGFIKYIPNNAIIFVDIDFTIITPISKTFINKDTRITDQVIKPNKHLYSTEEYEKILSSWRKQRQVKLIDKNWPDMLNQLKQKHKVYGLTKVETGKFGDIESMEEWRSSELKKLKIEFSHDILLPSINRASFYNGIFMTGPNSKSDTLSFYLKYLPIANRNDITFVMVDDIEEELNSMEKFCKNNAIKFLGILFKGLEKFKEIPDPNIVSLQTEYLLNYKKWLEDEEAEEELAKRASTVTPKPLKLTL